MRLQGDMSLNKNGFIVPTAFIWRMLAVLVIGALLAHWVWVVFAPRSASVLPAVLPVSGLPAEHLFGIAAASSVPGTTAQAALPNLRLLGVFAGSPGFAIFELDGKRQLGLATGQEIAQGVKLVEVAVEHVVIERGGVRQQVQLEGNESATRNVAAAMVKSIQLR